MIFAAKVLLFFDIRIIIFNQFSKKYHHFQSKAKIKGGKIVKNAYILAYSKKKL